MGMLLRIPRARKPEIGAPHPDEADHRGRLAEALCIMLPLGTKPFGTSLLHFEGRRTMDVTSCDCYGRKLVAKHGLQGRTELTCLMCRGRESTKGMGAESPPAIPTITGHVQKVWDAFRRT
jgi:hypothetical protein